MAIQAYLDTSLGRVKVPIFECLYEAPSSFPTRVTVTEMAYDGILFPSTDQNDGLPVPTNAVCCGGARDTSLEPVEPWNSSNFGFLSTFEVYDGAVTISLKSSSSYDNLKNYQITVQIGLQSSSGYYTTISQPSASAFALGLCVFHYSDDSWVLGWYGTTRAVLVNSVGTPISSFTSATIKVNTIRVIFAAAVLLGSAPIPVIPPEEQDTPYFPENPTDPSQQPTEPQIGPTPGEWILHEDYIPRLPSPNNDLGLGIMRAYSMDKVQLTGFSNALWSDNILTVMKTMLANPLDVVISLMSFPFEIQNYSAAEDIQFVWLSQWIPGSCNGNPLTSEIQVINFGQIEVKRYSGTFYDYEPYSSCTLYLPYIGYVTLKVNEILGKTLRLQYIVNLLTGNFTAVIDVDGNPQIISQFQGVIGRPLPLSSGDFYNIVQTTAKIAEGFATGGVAGAMVGLGAGAASMLASTPQFSGTAIGPVLPQTDGEEGGTGLKQAASLMSKGRKIATFTANAMESVAAASGSIQRAGSIGPVSGRTSTQDAYIILTLPHQNVPENQALLGYPTNLPGPLANYKGYTEVRSIELQADGATDGELAELQDILQGGIVITE